MATAAPSPKVEDRTELDRMPEEVELATDCPYPPEEEHYRKKRSQRKTLKILGGILLLCYMVALPLLLIYVSRRVSNAENELRRILQGPYRMAAAITKDEVVVSPTNPNQPRSIEPMSDYSYNEIYNTQNHLRVSIESLEVLSKTLESRISHIELLERNRTQNESNKDQEISAIEGDPTSVAVFTRWGRKNCSPESVVTTVYAGFAASTNFFEDGGGSNYLCLSGLPEYDPNMDLTVNEERAEINGVVHSAAGSLFRDPSGDNLNPSFATGRPSWILQCSVCMLKRSSVLMIPAKRTCPEDWNLEYSGFLMSNRKHHKRSQFICVDGTPDMSVTLDKVQADRSAEISFVELYCGPLPCPPYQGYAEISCVVCSK